MPETTVALRSRAFFGRRPWPRRGVVLGREEGVLCTAIWVDELDMRNPRTTASFDF